MGGATFASVGAKACGCAERSELEWLWPLGNSLNLASVRV